MTHPDDPLRRLLARAPEPQVTRERVDRVVGAALARLDAGAAAPPVPRRAWPAAPRLAWLAGAMAAGLAVGMLTLPPPAPQAARLDAAGLLMTSLTVERISP
ncbi:MAG TPA: hypothetical protein VED40_18815 [Azospirillaceae bacterium]|nr:hypothetical protein [Azospirillaceae bacterium]